jgi:hypothetical protein
MGEIREHAHILTDEDNDADSAGVREAAHRFSAKRRCVAVDLASVGMTGGIRWTSFDSLTLRSGCIEGRTVECP